MAKINKRFAYSYERWSSAGQSSGDSHSRQADAAAEYVKTRPDLQLSDRKFIDCASGFSQTKKRAKGNALELTTDQEKLQSFLTAVANEELPPNPTLLIEGFDRFSRDKPYRALSTLMAMIDADIEVVFLKPNLLAFTKDKCDESALFQAIIGIASSHAHSLNLSNKLGAWWVKSRAEQRAVPFLPAWLSHRNSKQENRRVITSDQKTPEQKYVIDERKAAAVRLVFQLCIDGLGHDAIVLELIKRKVAPITRIGSSTKSGIKKVAKWSATYVSHLLGSRNVLGFYQPCIGKHKNKNRTKAGDERLEYPEIITPELFAAAQRAIATRSRKGGKRAVGVNLFNGLIHDAISGIAYWRVGSVYMVGRERLQTEDKSCRKFPAKYLESTILKLTSELNAAELQPERRNLNALYKQAQDELTEVQLNISQLEAMQLAKFRTERETRLEAFYDQRDELQAALKQTRQAEPFADQFNEYVSAINYASGTDEQRQQLAGLLRRVVKRISVAVHTMGYKKPNRSFVAKIEFITGEVRYVFGMQFADGSEHSGTCKFSKKEQEKLPQVTGKEWGEYAEQLLLREIVVRFTKAS